MSILPWRVREAISNKFPLFYHLVVNLVRKRAGADYWDKNLAEGWGVDDRRWPTKLEIIVKRANQDSEILDIACGNGSMLRGLRERGFKQLSGLEISRYAVMRLREEGFTMYQGELPKIPIFDNSFDTVIASQVLEHIIRRHRFVTEITRVLKPGGEAFFFVPNDCLGPIDEPEHVIKYNSEKLEVFLGRYFDVVSIEVFKDANYAISILMAQVRNRAKREQNR